jgi:hypothetical protein
MRLLKHWCAGAIGVAMFEELLVQEPAGVATTTNADVGRAQESERLVRLFAVRSYSIGLGIALAGAVYPCVVSIGIFLLTVVQLNHFPKFNPSLYHSDIDEAVAIVFYGSTIGAGVGLLWSTVICIAVLPFVYLVALSLQARGSLTRLGAFAGGLVGFVAVMPLLLDALRFAHSGTTNILPLIVFPGLTTILGQVGGAWGGRRVAQHERAFATQSIKGVGGAGASAIIVQSPRIQFGIRHLLWVAVWVSLLLTAIRLIFGSFELVLPLLVGWLVYQVATIWVGERLIRAWCALRARRQTRST